MSPPNISLWARDAASEIKSVPSTLSSWDKCMAKSYCKWPVIVGIIVGSVIVIAILASSAPAAPAYQSPAAPPAFRGTPQTRSTPQTARFDSPKTASSTVNEDALPAMPTWEGAVDKRVEDPNAHGDDVEMEPLNPHGQTPDRKQGAGTPMYGTAYSDYPPNREPSPGGYRGFGPVDPYSRRSPAPAAALATQDPYGRRSPGPAAAFAAAKDPYGRRSPGLVSPVATQDPYGRRSPGLASPVAGQDPYGRRSPGPAAAYATQDPYGRRSPGLASPAGPPVHNPYDPQPYHQQSYDDYSPGGQYNAITSPSPVAAYKPHTAYSPVPMAFSPSSEVGHGTPAPGFQRQPSGASSQYPPTYTSQPPYRGVSPSLPTSPPPPFPAPSPSVYTAHDPHPDPSRDRPPSLLQSGPKGSYRDF
ncbi:hypothetical protein NUU61_003842 [Penicillium alfredii]|uniref:Uncharacterized protein n=1 Tax=Penicillium alfredii TaxID=1506179 RepID=A0A9W9FK30_9EURO|nr:uncharacterized protein NUU61_003842 [Penicillium alfredii]KAJ5101620.1 hypothetical protein NUU61_003842 [Penicillium alfredii]